jgi:hypothetical protein
VQLECAPPPTPPLCSSLSRSLFSRERPRERPRPHMGAIPSMCDGWRGYGGWVHAGAGARLHVDGLSHFSRSHTHSSERRVESVGSGAVRGMCAGARLHVDGLGVDLHGPRLHLRAERGEGMRKSGRGGEGGPPRACRIEYRNGQHNTEMVNRTQYDDGVWRGACVREQPRGPPRACPPPAPPPSPCTEGCVCVGGTPVRPMRQNTRAVKSRAVKQRAVKPKAVNRERSNRERSNQ